MRRFWPVILLILLAIPVAGYSWLRFSNSETESASNESAQAETSFAAPEAETPTGPQPPPTLARTITTLGENFDGDVGIAVQSVEDSWVAAHNGDLKLPQQSLSKLWVAATVLDRVDSGELALDEIIPLTAADLSIFHQPIRKKILTGGYRPTIAELLRFAMTQSDNAANGALFRRVGGQAGVTRFLIENDLGDILMSEGEKELQMSIVGMEWQDRFSYGRHFWQAREKLPFGARAEAMGRYLEDPPDGATPIAVASGLAELQRGNLLSRQSSAYLIDLMARSKTGPKRLRGGLSDGWTMPHKTGTGQVLKFLATAYNDVGILTSPAGRHYAVVVMIGATNRPVPERQELMQAVVRAVIDCEEAGLAGCGGLSTFPHGDGTSE